MGQTVFPKVLDMALLDAAGCADCAASCRSRPPPDRHCQQIITDSCQALAGCITGLPHCWVSLGFQQKCCGCRALCAQIVLRPCVVKFRCVSYLCLLRVRCRCLHCFVLLCHLLIALYVAAAHQVGSFLLMEMCVGIPCHACLVGCVVPDGWSDVRGQLGKLTDACS